MRVDRQRELLVARDEVAGDAGEAERLGLVDSLPIDGQAGGQPHAAIGPRRAGRPLLGELEEEDAVRPHRGEREAGRALDLLGDGPVDEVDDVHLVALQGGRPRGLVGDAADDQPLHARLLAPVPVERFQHQLHARLKAHELEGAGADGRLAEAVLAHRLDVLLRHDPGRPRGAGAVEGHEVAPRLVQDEPHVTGVHHLHLLDALAEQRSAGALVALEGELHVLARDGIAVVEARALAQHEIPRAAIFRHRPGLGQRGRVEVARHRLHQGVVERVVDHERRDLGLGLGRVEPARGERDVDPERHGAGRLSGDARGEAQRQHDERKERTGGAARAHAGLQAETVPSPAP